jgi:uncharacterized protein (TIGR00369 family)
VTGGLTPIGGKGNVPVLIHRGSVARVKALRQQVEAIFDRAPFIIDLGIRLMDVDRGLVKTELDLEDRFRQQHGFAHAGIVSTLADHTAGAAASTVIDVGKSVLTADFNIHLLRPGAGNRLTCTGEVVRKGRSLIVTQADVWADDEHCARYVGTMVVVDRAV